MKKILSLFAALTVVVSTIWADSPETLTLSTATGIAEVTVNKNGSNQTVNNIQGGDVSLSKGDVTVTAQLGYFKGSGSDGIQVYKNGTMTVTVPEGNVITKITMSLPSGCYPFSQTPDIAWSLSSGKTGSAQTRDFSYGANVASNSVTFTNTSVGQTKVKILTVTYGAQGAQGGEGGGQGSEGGEQGGDQGGEGGEQGDQEEKTCAFVLNYDGVDYAAGVNIASSKSPKVAVNVVNGVVYVASEEEKAAIAWTISETNSGYLIKAGSKYLKGTNGATSLTLVDDPCYWKKKVEEGNESYWISKDANDYYRTITYQAGSTDAFKAYTASNIGSSGYASTPAYVMPIVVCPKISVSTAQYATYYHATYSYTMPEGLEGIVVSGCTNNSLTLDAMYDAGDVVPAGEPLILRATTELTETTSFILYTGTTSDASYKSVDLNLLSGTSTAEEMTEGGNKYYRLSIHDGKVGFYWGAAEGAAFKPGANKAYLALSGTNAPDRFVFNPSTPIVTGVENTECIMHSAKCIVNGRLVIKRGARMYDLNGRLVK